MTHTSNYSVGDLISNGHIVWEVTQEKKVKVLRYEYVASNQERFVQPGSTESLYGDFGVDFKIIGSTKKKTNMKRLQWV